MKLELLEFICSHCKIKVLVNEGKNETQAICGNCGRWMEFSDKFSIEAKVHGKNAGDQAIIVEKEEVSC